MLDIISGEEDLKNVQLLKEKNPALYKALSIVSLIDSGKEENIDVISKSLESYINKMSEKVLSNKSPLEYPIPEDSTQIDLLSNKLAKDLMDDIGITSGDVTPRFQSLIKRTLNCLKTSGDNYVKTQKEQYLEECIGYYDQLMLLKEIAILADKTT